jgi:hypothetical protein
MGLAPESVFECMDRVITPLCAEGFDVLLAQFDLVRTFPTLSHRIRHGFPIGNFLPLRRTYAFENHFSNPEHGAYIHRYLLEEVDLGRMSGPFSEDNLRAQFRELHFQTAPLSAVPKVGNPGELRIVRNASFQGSAPCSVNDQINPDEQSTRWGKASDMAEIVSHSLYPVGG